MVQSVAWNSECNMLAAIHDSRFSVFLYPTVIYVDRGLLGNDIIVRCVEKIRFKLYSFSDLI